MKGETKNEKFIQHINKRPTKNHFLVGLIDKVIQQAEVNDNI